MLLAATSLLVVPSYHRKDGRIGPQIVVSRVVAVPSAVPIPRKAPAAPQAPEPTPKPVAKVYEPKSEPKVLAGSIPARIAKAWPGNDAEALAVSGCESAGSRQRWNPAATNGQHLGLFQIASNVHARRIARHGFTRAQMLTVEPNVKVAWELYSESGWGPWRWSGHCHHLS